MGSELNNLNNEYKRGLLKIIIDLLDDSIKEKAKNNKVKITEDTSLFADLGMDSLERYEFGYNVEEEIGTTIKDGDVMKLETFKDYTEYLFKNRNYKE